MSENFPAWLMVMGIERELRRRRHERLAQLGEPRRPAPAAPVRPRWSKRLREGVRAFRRRVAEAASRHAPRRERAA